LTPTFLPDLINPDILGRALITLIERLFNAVVTLLKTSTVLKIVVNELPALVVSKADC